MRSHDFDEIAALLHIGRQAHEFGNLQNIASAAAARLKQINEEMQPDGLGGPSPQTEPQPKVRTSPAKTTPLPLLRTHLQSQGDNQCPKAESFPAIPGT